MFSGAFWPHFYLFIFISESQWGYSYKFTYFCACISVIQCSSTHPSTSAHSLPLMIPVSLLPLHSIPPLHPISVAGHSLLFSLSFWVLSFAMEVLGGHHVQSIVCFQHASPILSGSSHHTWCFLLYLNCLFPQHVRSASKPWSRSGTYFCYSWVLVLHSVVLYSADECNSSMSVSLRLISLSMILSMLIDLYAKFMTSSFLTAT